MKSFLARFGALVAFTLSGFDRLRFRGESRLLNNGRGVESYLFQQNLRCIDFPDYAEELTARLRRQTEADARDQGVPYRPLNSGAIDKEAAALDLAGRHGLSSGRIPLLSAVESARVYRLRKNPAGLVTPVKQDGKCVHYYHYFRHPELGLCYVRVQTWFPFTTQVYVNGHDWLARQLQQAGVGFVQQDNAFTQLDDPVKAQELAEGFARLPWTELLESWTRQVNPLLEQPWLSGKNNYWVIDQAEYSTDVLFKSREHLAGLYPRLLDHAVVNFSAKDILTFLGRRLHPRFDGEVLTDCKKDRWPGARIKHRVKNNWLKMYDKFGQILRIETVINNPREFKVRRRRQRQRRWEMCWCPMNKGVSNFYHYQEVAQAANGRYLEALAVVEDPQPTYRRVEELAQPKVQSGRSYAGFNPARQQDVELFRAVLAGGSALQGFRNADVRRTLFGEARQQSRRRREAAAVGRRLKRLHVRGLIAKVPRSRRWRVTAKGQSLLGAVVRLYHHGLPVAA